MNSKYEEAKEASKQNMQEAQDIPTMVCVQEHNWLALISQLKLLTNEADTGVARSQRHRYNEQRVQPCGQRKQEAECGGDS